jgi:hypothetical protein
MMTCKAEKRLIAIAELTREKLGNEIICNRCGCTAENMSEKCDAPLDVRCPGFDRYDEVRMKYERTIPL